MNIFTTAAKGWLEEIEKKQKITKSMRRAVLSFGMWLDSMIQQQEMKEERKHDKEN